MVSKAKNHAKIGSKQGNEARYMSGITGWETKNEKKTSTVDIENYYRM